jgi:hypothetical protein
MRHAMMIVAAVAMLGGFSTTASAQKIDANGRCHARDGKFAKMEICKGVGGEHHEYKMDGKGKCHDEHGKFAKTEFCHH